MNVRAGSQESELGNFPFTSLLSLDPRSYRCLVARIITTTPLQSAIALPKNEPDVLFLIAHAIERDPGQQNATGHNGKAVPFKERLVLFLAQRKFQDRHLNPNLKTAT